MRNRRDHKYKVPPSWVFLTDMNSPSLPLSHGEHKCRQSGWSSGVCCFPLRSTGWTDLHLRGPSKVLVPNSRVGQSYNPVSEELRTTLETILVCGLNGTSCDLRSRWEETHCRGPFGTHLIPFGTHLHSS